MRTAALRQPPLTLIEEGPEHVYFASPGTSHGTGWRAGAAREEIRPAFSYEERGGPGGRGGAFVISAEGRAGGCMATGRRPSR